jgi:hypothetical protein
VIRKSSFSFLLLLVFWSSAKCDEAQTGLDFCGVQQTRITCGSAIPIPIPTCASTGRCDLVAGTADTFVCSRRAPNPFLIEEEYNPKYLQGEDVAVVAPGFPNTILWRHYIRDCKTSFACKSICKYDPVNPGVVPTCEKAQLINITGIVYSVPIPGPIPVECTQLTPPGPPKPPIQEGPPQ